KDEDKEDEDEEEDDKEDEEEDEDDKEEEGLPKVKHIESFITRRIMNFNVYGSVDGLGRQLVSHEMFFQVEHLSHHLHLLMDLFVICMNCSSTITASISYCIFVDWQSRHGDQSI